MEDRRDKQIVQEVFESSLSGIQDDPWMAQRVLNAANPKGGKIMVKKVPSLVVVLMVVLALSVSTAIAAGVISWHRGLEDMLRVTDKTKEYYQAMELFDEPGMSVTQGDVTVTLEQSIVDTNAAYFAFRVKGYQPPEGQQPAFDSADVSVENKEFIINCCDYSFFNGLVCRSDGKAVYLDGSVPDDYSAVPYTDENGELVYIIRMFSVTPDMIGQNMTITLTDLGVYTDKGGTCEVQAPGTWTFTCKLKGTEHNWDFSGLNLAIGDSGSKITQVHLSPIHIQMTMDVPYTFREYQAYEDGDNLDWASLMPYFYGITMKDGARYDLITEAGAEGYTTLDPDCHEYQILFTLNRIIEPANVDAFLFSCPDENGEHKIVEVPFNKLH